MHRSDYSFIISETSTHSFACHSVSLKPISTKSSPTRIGRLTNIPSLASRESCSSSVIDGSFFDNSSALYCKPLVLKKRLRGRPLFAYQSRNSASVGFSVLMSRKSYFTPLESRKTCALRQVVHLG